MIKPRSCPFMLLLLGCLAFHAVSADEPGRLEITTQGFSADQPQQGTVGEISRLRVRIEASDRIKELTIKERSYEVDLASTRDKDNLQLFGLAQSPRSFPDVTLNLQNYINEKIIKAGEYVFHVLVTDKNDVSAEKKIYLDIRDAVSAAGPVPDEDAGLLQTGSFTLQRTGTGPVKGSRQFGIEWITVDNANVTVRITRSGDGQTRLVRPDKPDFDKLRTNDQLVGMLADAEMTEAVFLATAGNKAAGEVFSVCPGDKCYLLKVVKSSAYPSKNGTIVTLEGDYKYQQTGD